MNLAEATLWDDARSDTETISWGSITEAGNDPMYVHLRKHAVAQSSLPLDLTGYSVVASASGADGEEYGGHYYGEVAEMVQAGGLIQLMVPQDSDSSP
jgi:hypothetical protein